MVSPDWNKRFAGVDWQSTRQLMEQSGLLNGKNVWFYHKGRLRKSTPLTGLFCYKSPHIR